MAALSDPSYKATAVTPNDGSDLPGGNCRGIYIGVAGAVAVVLPGESTNVGVVFSNMNAGVVYPIRARRIKATGTTATSIVALY